MAEPSDNEFDPRYLKGFEYFNECEFFEAHEVWEDVWAEYRGPSRKFYQGLIQVAVALHHFGNGNVRGARKLYHSSRRYLEPFAPFHEGVDLAKLLDDFAACFQPILDLDDDAPAPEIVVDLIPEIHLGESAGP